MHLILNKKKSHGPKLKTKQWKIEEETDETEILMAVANHWKLD